MSKGPLRHVRPSKTGMCALPLTKHRNWSPECHILCMLFSFPRRAIHLFLLRWCSSSFLGTAEGGWTLHKSFVGFLWTSVTGVPNLK